ncbi:MAG TPA: hypothetical protein VJ944_03145 [Thermoplasmataceae archaeon]|nr:hypothetical protein [Thermoplasmataceae archaeon]
MESLKRISESGGGIVEPCPATHSTSVERPFEFLHAYLDEGFEPISISGKVVFRSGRKRINHQNG